MTVSKKLQLFLLLIFINSTQSNFTVIPQFTSSYTYLTNADIKKGYKTSEIGQYVMLTKGLVIKDSADINSDVSIGGISKNNVLISITKNNVTLDLNNQSIRAGKSGKIAIAIKNNVTGITIKNGFIISGSQDFDAAILIGKRCSNITLENITIQGSASTNLGAIEFQGSSSEPINNVTLENVTVHRTSSTGIKCSYVHNLCLKNIVCNAIDSTEKLVALNLDGCRYLTCKNIKATLNKGTGETIGIKVNQCKDAQFEYILSSSNEDNTAGAYSKNIIIKDSYNIHFSNAESTNTQNAHCGLGIVNSKQISLCCSVICNNHSGINSEFTALYITGSDSISVENCSISNCTGATNFNGILCDTATCTGLDLDNIKITANRAINGDLTGININDNELTSIESITISQNSSNNNIYALKASTNVKNLLCNNCCFFYNKSTTTALNKSVAGFHISNVIGLRLHNCVTNYNNGGSQAFGYYISSSHACEIKNCKAHLNWASSTINQAQSSAGFYFKDSNHCVLVKSDSLHNKGGNYAIGTGGSNSVGIDGCCGGFGLINASSDVNVPNIGNQFIECNFDGNGVQLPNSNPGSNHQSYSGGKRYWRSQALSAGAIELNSQQSIYTNCTFNNNGLSNYVFSSGFIGASGVKNVFLKSCIAGNNGFYGYTDLNNDCETYFIGCLTLGNGTYNPVARSVTSSQTDRNANIPYGSKNPFYVIKMDDYSDINNKNSAMHNYNVIGRRNSDEDD